RLLATGCTNAIVKAMNRAYGVEEARPFWRRYLLALSLTVLAGALTVGTFVLFVLGELVGPPIASAQFGEGVVETLLWLARWPLVLLLLVVESGLVYWLGPNVDLKWQWAVPGAALFGGGWGLTTALFSLYLPPFSNYSSIFGALPVVAILLIWFDLLVSG